MNIKIISHENRKQVNNFIMFNWHSLDMYVCLAMILIGSLVFLASWNLIQKIY